MIKIYETDSYKRECESTVTSCFEDGGNVFITLDQSIFFPEEGGQYADTGLLILPGKEIKLSGGQIKDGIVRYQIQEPIKEGTVVKCVLDWDKRFMRMQQHSAEHIASGRVKALLGFDNVGFHLSDDSEVTFDAGGQITPEQAYMIEAAANRIICKNMEISVSFPGKDELAVIPYRSKTDIEGQVRLVTIGSGDDIADICACCAPHVAHTGEIGILIFTRVQKYKNATRISMLAGERAYAYIRENLNILTRIAGGLTTSADKVEAVLLKQQSEIAELKARLAAALEEKLKKAMDEAKGKSVSIFLDDEISGGALNRAFEYGLLHHDEIIVFIKKENGFRYRLAGKNSVRHIQAKMEEGLNAKGGGRDTDISGQLPANRKEIESFLIKRGFTEEQ
ncbi:MAG: hypothetical protein II468_02495 [Lachnospiraceae bacterium]|nr:hypothetical protein [Lachnospiraceae bacterium]